MPVISAYIGGFDIPGIGGGEVVVLLEGGKGGWDGPERACKNL